MDRELQHRIRILLDILNPPPPKVDTSCELSEIMSIDLLNEINQHFINAIYTKTEIKAMLKL